MAIVFVDTNIVIEYLKGNEDIIESEKDILEWKLGQEKIVKRDSIPQATPQGYRLTGGFQLELYQKYQRVSNG